MNGKGLHSLVLAVASTVTEEVKNPFPDWFGTVLLILVTLVIAFFLTLFLRKKK